MSTSAELHDRHSTGADGLHPNNGFEKKGFNDYDDRSLISEDVEPQAGVKKIEAISTAWSKKSLIAAYVFLFIISNITALEVNTTYLMAIYATSSFVAHSLLAAVYTVQLVVNAVVKPTLAKVSDVFGRFEGFSIAILLYTLGYIQQAASKNVQTFAAAQIFYSSGSQGLQILQQVFVADTTDLLNRAFFSSIFDIPFLWAAWAGGPLAQALNPMVNWRWGYGMWAILLPVVFIPFALTLFLNQRKAGKMGILPKGPLHGKGPFAAAKTLWLQLDVFGVMLLAATLALILLPLSLAPRANNTWKNGSMIAMFVIGGLCLLVLPFWERSKKLAPYPVLPPYLFTNRTVICGFLIGFFYFMTFYLSVFPYFPSYLLVVSGRSVAAAGQITQTFNYSSTVASLVVSLLIKYTGRYKYFITFGGCLYLVGVGLMVRYRTEGVGTGTLVGTQLAIGIGGGMLNVPAQLGVQASVSHQNVGIATAVFLCLVEVGGAVGAAISGAIWTSGLPNKLDLYLPPELQSQSALIFGNITLAMSFPVGSPARDAINRAWSETMRNLLIAACCAAAPIIPLSLLMKNYKLDEMNQHVKGTVIGGDQPPVGTADPVGITNAAVPHADAAARPSKFAFLNRFRRTA